MSVLNENITFYYYRNYAENASKGFFHRDFIGQTYLCYLLTRKCELILLPILKKNNETTFEMHHVIPAKDATALLQLNIIVVLGVCGTIMIYSGTTFIGKIHVGGILSKLMEMSSVSNLYFETGLPRRSSLLPTILHTPGTKFEDEFHTLSPVHPLQYQSLDKNRMCEGLRDPAGSSVTALYPGGKMYRFSLPIISGSFLVIKCLIALRTILIKDLALKVNIK